MLSRSVFFEHGICVFPHHVVDGFDDVHHLLERAWEHSVGTIVNEMSPLRMKPTKGAIFWEPSPTERAVENSRCLQKLLGRLLLLEHYPQGGDMCGIGVDMFVY